MADNEDHNPTGFERFRKRLIEEQLALDAEEAASAEGRQTVELDQQMVGRLSRMDALQGQAMAQAQSRRRSSRRQRIAAALARLDEGEFGYCAECGELIATARLDVDPTTPTCVSCAKG